MAISNYPIWYEARCCLPLICVIAGDAGTAVIAATGADPVTAATVAPAPPLVTLFGVSESN